WSDLPVIVLTKHGPDSPSVRRAVADLGNVTLLERPVRTLTLITSVHAILRARSKQYLVRETDRRKDEFLASLGHELRNPLAPIKTAVSLLQHLYPDVAQVDRIGEIIGRQVSHLTRLVDDLLDVARITSGKIELKLQPISLYSVLTHARELCEQAADKKSIVIEWRLPAGDVSLFGDHSRLVQTLANILSNAVKFTPGGGHISVTAEIQSELLSLRIKDNGIGLEPAVIPRIFMMFEQSRTVSGEILGGLGIGLSLSRQFAEMHGGHVDAHSEGLGQGSEFIISLPIVIQRPPAPATADAPVADAVEKPALRVLIVDDNSDAADTLAMLFELENFNVATVYDGNAAVASVAERRPDIIVMDLSMPGMDGYSTASAIRELAGSERILIIALSGWGQNDAKQQALAAGFNYHLTKPVDYEELKRLLNDCAELRQ
uniref:response regulator n=1 Tax=Undibacterium sp. TaxID=1914977 RepID=UPI00374DD99E